MILASVGVAALLAILAECDGQEEAEPPRPTVPRNSDSLSFGEPPAPPAPVVQGSPAPPPSVEPGRLVLDPPEVEFGAMTADGRPVERSVRLRNVGRTAVPRPAVQAGGVAAAALLCPDPIPPGQSCELVLSLVPDRAGRVQGGALVANDGRGQPLQLLYRGEVIAAETGQVATAAGPAPVNEARLSALARRQGSGHALVAAAPPVQRPAAQKVDPASVAQVGIEEIGTSLPVDRSRLLTPDMYVFLTLEHDLLSTIGGDINAVVREPVWSRGGPGEPRYELFAKGDRWIGAYGIGGTEASTGRRIDIEWRQVWRGNGVVASFKWPTADQMGRIGAVGELQQQLGARYGAEALQTLMAIGGVLAVPNSQTTTTTSPFGTTTTGNARNEALLQQIEQSRARFVALTEQVFREAYPSKPANLVAAGTILQVRPRQVLRFRHPSDRSGGVIEPAVAADAVGRPLGSGASGATLRPALQAPGTAGVTRPASSPAVRTTPPAPAEDPDEFEEPAEPVPTIRRPPPYTPPPILAQ